MMYYTSFPIRQVIVAEFADLPDDGEDKKGTSPV